MIITADDFGLAPEVNKAVEIAHKGGILTAASLMVSGRAATEAVAMARRLPALRVGLHLVLVDGLPTLPAERIPDLVDGDGRLRRDLMKIGIDIFARPGVRRQLAAEIDAQFAAFRATGLPLDHVNAHHHFHLHPTVCALMLEIGKRYEAKAVRVPREPEALDGPRLPGSRAGAWALAPWVARLDRRVRDYGMTAPAQVFGLAWSGAMTRERMLRLLKALPDGITEIYCHPATSNVFVDAVQGYRYADELDALTAQEVMSRARDNPIRTGGYLDFALK